jgi:hypothetical protein
VTSAGLPEPVLSKHHDWLIVSNVSAARVERLLGAPLYQHRDTKTGAVVARLRGAYSIPTVVAPHVLNIQPIHSVPPTRLTLRTHRFHRDRPRGETATWPHDCKGLTKPGMITPAVVRKRYNFSLPATSASPAGSIAAMLPGPIGAKSRLFLFATQVICLKCSMDLTLICCVCTGVLDSEVAYIQSDCGLPNHKIAKFVGINSVKACSKTGQLTQNTQQLFSGIHPRA